jgi:hypothetical protein
MREPGCKMFEVMSFVEFEMVEGLECGRMRCQHVGILE